MTKKSEVVENHLSITCAKPEFHYYKAGFKGKNGMTPSTRQATGNLPPSTLKRKAEDDSVVEDEVDPDFLALSRAQQNTIDAAYERATGSTKRRKTGYGLATGKGGGFMTEGGGGGFLPDDGDGQGGFVDDMMMGGGFMTENAEEPIAQPTSHLYEQTDIDGITLSAMPKVMNSLQLTWDEDVLAAFEGVCTQTTSTGETYATRRDFRAVCAALMEPEENGEDQRMSEDNDDDDDEQDAYADGQEDAEMQVSDASSPLSEDDNEGDFGTPSSKAKTKGKGRKDGKGKKTKTNDRDLRLDPAAAQVKLSREQKEWITMMWNTMFEGSQPSIIAQRGPRVLGKEEVKRWAGMMDQTWSDAEVMEMIEVFSTIPGKRGLSYDDFTTVLLRAGLVQF